MNNTSLYVGIIVFVVFTVIGFLVKDYYVSRNKIICDIKEYLRYTLLRVKNYKDEIGKINLSYSFATLDAKRILIEKDSVCADYFLSKNEKSTLIEFDKSISIEDYSTLCNSLGNYLEEYEKYHLASEKSIKTKGDLYFKLLCLFGLTVCLMIC